MPVGRCSLFFAPDLSMLGHLVHPKIGAATYYAAHTTVVYGPLAARGYLSGLSVALKNCLNMIDLSVDPPLFDGNELFFVGNAGLRLRL